MVIKLTEEEKNVVRAEAQRRQSECEQLNLKGRNGGEAVGDLALQHHKYGAAGEMAVASYLGLKDQLFQDKFGLYDLPGKIDVKTRSKHWYDLIVQMDDKPGKNYWLVTIENKEIRLHGWLPWVECAKPEYAKTPNSRGKAYFVPKDRLYPPESWKEHLQVVL